MSTEDLRAYLTIDKNLLDEELTQQAALFDEVGEQWAEAISLRDKLKENLAVADAEADHASRLILGTTATEAKIKSAVLLSEKHRDATVIYLEAKLKADKLQVLRESFEQRAKMLDKLAQLYISNYFMKDSVRPGPAAAEATYRARRARENERGGKFMRRGDKA